MPYKYSECNNTAKPYTAKPTFKVNSYYNIIFKPVQQVNKVNKMSTDDDDDAFVCAFIQMC